MTVRPSNGSEAVAQESTDAQGRWCLDIGERELGMALVARATIEGIDLRRPLLTGDAQIVSVRSEAVWRLLKANLDDPTAVSPATYLNLEAMVSTATDLVKPVDWRAVETLREAIEQTVEQAGKDQRVSQKLDELEG